MCIALLCRHVLSCCLAVQEVLPFCYGAVVDECPECQSASLDFQNNFGGRDPVNWVAVQCAVAGTNFVYSFQVTRPVCIIFQ